MWTCPKCKQKVEDDFEVCWKCGTSKDGVEDPTFEQERSSDSAETPPGNETEGTPSDTEPETAAAARRQGCFSSAVLSIAAILSLVGCVGAVVGGLWLLYQNRLLEALVGSPLAFIYQAAMFLVFTRVQRI